MSNNLRALVAEAVGAALLVFLAVGTAVTGIAARLGTQGPPPGTLVITMILAVGLLLLGLANVVGPLSGTHLLPAVTMATLRSRRMATDSAVDVWLGQLFGAVAAAAALVWFVPWATTSPSTSTTSSDSGLTMEDLALTAFLAVVLLMLPLVGTMAALAWRAYREVRHSAVAAPSVNEAPVVEVKGADVGAAEVPATAEAPSASIMAVLPTPAMIVAMHTPVLVGPAPPAEPRPTAVPTVPEPAEVLAPATAPVEEAQPVEEAASVEEEVEIDQPLTTALPAYAQAPSHLGPDERIQAVSRPPREARPMSSAPSAASGSRDLTTSLPPAAKRKGPPATRVPAPFSVAQVPVAQRNADLDALRGIAVRPPADGEGRSRREGGKADAVVAAQPSPKKKHKKKSGSKSKSTSSTVTVQVKVVDRQKKGKKGKKG